jgi:hypothetical protein
MSDILFGNGKEDYYLTERLPILIRDAKKKENVPAVLVDGITLPEIETAQEEWFAFLENVLQDALELPEHKHWDWVYKAKDALAKRYYRMMGIVCEEQVQGLMLLSFWRTSQLPNQADLPIVYVHYLATAPWNLRSLVQEPRYAGIGQTLIAAAVAKSVSLGCEGRLGLHSLPQAETFYGNTCGMTPGELDPSEEDLRYFEMTSEQATIFLGRR